MINIIKSIPIKNYSLNILEELTGFQVEFERILEDNTDIIELKNNLFPLELLDKFNLEFYFSISQPIEPTPGSPNNAKERTTLIFESGMRPASESLAISRPASRYGGSDLLQNLKAWISIVRSYSNLIESDQDKYVRIYTEEIFSYFQLIDAGSDTMPFNSAQQEVLFLFLEDLETRMSEIQNPTPEIIDVIKETLDLQNSITKLPRNKFLKKLAKLSAKLKSIDFKTFIRTVGDVAKKEIIKQALYASYHETEALTREFMKLIGH